MEPRDRYDFPSFEGQIKKNCSVIILDLRQMELMEFSIFRLFCFQGTFRVWRVINRYIVFIVKIHISTYDRFDQFKGFKGQKWRKMDIFGISK